MCHCRTVALAHAATQHFHPRLSASLSASLFPTSVVDVSSEWRTFANDDKKRSSDDPSRVGGGENHLLTGAQLTTGITFNAKIGEWVWTTDHTHTLSLTHTLSHTVFSDSVAANADCVLVRRSNLGGVSDSKGLSGGLRKGPHLPTNLSPPKHLRSSKAPTAR